MRRLDLFRLPRIFSFVTIIIIVLIGIIFIMIVIIISTNVIMGFRIFCMILASNQVYYDRYHDNYNFHFKLSLFTVSLTDDS